jgi:2-oxoglutarate dehydrogenase E2 component (dihydrolipoamide succinyltransferase)
MSIEIRVPPLGESIVEATVGRWLKSEGDTVAVGDPLVELETEKVNMEVAASSAGVLRSIRKRVGQTVGIGEVLAIIGDAREKGETASEASATVARARVPSEDRRAGACAEALPGAAPAGRASELASAPTSTPAPTSQPSAPEPVPAGSLAETESAEGGARATPLARRIAAERGVDLAQVTGTGPAGRITHDDVNAYLAQRGNGSSAPATPSPAQTASAGAVETALVSAPPIALPAPSIPPIPPSASSAISAVSLPARPEERIRMSRRRQTIARRLVEAQHTAAMLTTFNEVDMSAILELRKRRRDAFKERYGVNLGFMSFFIKAVVGALKAFPRLNAEIDGEEMVLKRYYDIGIAVSTPEGLVVPVVRDADRLSFAAIERQVATLAEKARDKTLSLEELQGGTFTITNGGVFGSLLSTPILNYPQVGILGMHKVQERPIALGGQVAVHPMMYVALSYDHRIVDGAEAVSFLVRVKELLEDPEQLLLEG